MVIHLQDAFISSWKPPTHSSAPLRTKLPFPLVCFTELLFNKLKLAAFAPMGIVAEARGVDTVVEVLHV